MNDNWVVATISLPFTAEVGDLVQIVGPFSYDKACQVIEQRERDYPHYAHLARVLFHPSPGWPS